MTTKASTRRRGRASRALAIAVGSLLALAGVTAAAAAAPPITVSEAPFTFD